jgi:hypothetical protein
LSDDALKSSCDLYQPDSYTPESLQHDSDRASDYLSLNGDPVSSLRFSSAHDAVHGAAHDAFMKRAA